jgi:oligopeptide/dipeptide ABC transporter ATP-binding protein
MNTIVNPPLLKVSGLRSWFPIRKGVFQKIVGYVRAVDGVDLSIDKGQTVALVGESGCGKTTVGRTIMHLIDSHDGAIIFDGVDLTKLNSVEFAAFRKRMQMVFQDPMSSLDPRMTVRDIVAEGLVSFGIGENYDDRTNRVGELLQKVRLDPEQMWLYPHEFSGGQRQRICIARALAVDPEFLIFDESISALDVSIQAQILNLLSDLQRELDLTYLFITHDLGVVRYFADRVAVMYVGQIVEEGATRDLFETPMHPYTQTLIAAIPSVDPNKRAARAQAIGEVPSPSNPPPGCRFQARCPSVMDRCRVEEPVFVEHANRGNRCFLDDGAPPAL